MKQAINTKTQEEYDALMRYYESKGMRWSGGERPTKFDNWSRFKKNTWIVPEYFERNVLEYCSTEELKGNQQISIRIPYTEFAKANIEPDYRALYLEGREVLEKLSRMSKDSGRAGCTYGDTDYDSLSVVYGYNMCLEHIQDDINTYLTKHKDGE